MQSVLVENVDNARPYRQPPCEVDEAEHDVAQRVLPLVILRTVVAANGSDDCKRQKDVPHEDVKKTE